MIKIKINNLSIYIKIPITFNNLINYYINKFLKRYLNIKINKIDKNINILLIKNCIIEYISFNSKDGFKIIKHDINRILSHSMQEIKLSLQLENSFVKGYLYYYNINILKKIINNKILIIEKKMREIIKMKLLILKQVISYQEIVIVFYKKKQFLKIMNIIKKKTDQKLIIFYQRNFLDLYNTCYSNSFLFIKKFKIIKILQIDFKKNKNLQRIYGMFLNNKKKEDVYLLFLKKKYDHRTINTKMKLFYQENYSKGSIFWTTSGWNLFQQLINYIREKQNKNGYLEINTPEIMSKKIWENSGHWSKFKNNMYKINIKNENLSFNIRPMNCIGSIMVYKKYIKSYKYLPLRLSEFGKVYRYELSGSICGLLRLRTFTQDDAHIFCSFHQVNNECLNIFLLILNVYKDIGFFKIKIKFSDRPKKRIGLIFNWNKSEQFILNILNKLKIDFIYNKASGSFYGPKIEFVLYDAKEKDWQLGTIQIDLNLPKKLNLFYFNNYGVKIKPIIIHRAIFGSIERFIGIILEYYKGLLPLWLSPIQVLILSISKYNIEYTNYVYYNIKSKKIRCKLDVTKEKISYKIKYYSLLKIPIIITIGEKEKKEKKIIIKKLKDKKIKVLALSKFIATIMYNIKNKKNRY